MKKTRDRDYYINSDRCTSSSEDTTKESHCYVTTNTVNRDPDTNYPFDMLTSSSTNGESEPNGYKSNANPKIDLDRAGNTSLDVLRIKETVTNTAQHDRENIDYCVASNDLKNDMINDNNSNHIDIKRNPRSLSKLTHTTKHIFTISGSFNDREKVNDIPLYSNNFLAGKDNNCRI